MALLAVASVFAIAGAASGDVNVPKGSISPVSLTPELIDKIISLYSERQISASTVYSPWDAGTAVGWGEHGDDDFFALFSDDELEWMAPDYPLLALAPFDPLRTGIYAFSASLDNIPVGTKITYLTIITHLGGTSGAETRATFLLDRNGNEVQEVPNDHYIIVATNCSASTRHFVSICERRSRPESAPLKEAIIIPITEELTDEQRQRIVDAVDEITDPSQILLLSHDDLSDPKEPTQAMRDQVKAAEYEFAAKLDTVTISESGYYAFKIELPPELVGIDVKDLQFYLARQSEFPEKASAASAAKDPRLVTSGLIQAAFAFLGDGNLLPIDKTTSTVFAILSLNAGEPLSLYLVKMLLMLVGACDAGSAAGTVGLLAVGGLVILRSFRRRK